MADTWESPLAETEVAEPRGRIGWVRGLAIAAAVLLAADLVAIGVHRSPSAGVPATVALRSATAQLAAHTVSIHMTVDISVMSHNVTMIASGHEDYGTRSADMTMSYTAVPGLSSIDLVVAGGYIYARLPQKLVPLAPGKSWVRMVDPTVSSSPSFDPAQAFAYLSIIASSLRNAGSTSIDGEPVTHYTGTVQLGSLPHPTSITIPPSIAAAPMTFDVWVDGSGRVRRTAQVVTLDLRSVAPGAGTERTAATTDFLDYGAPVHISPPPAAEVQDGAIPGLAPATTTT